jgi:hypothetical protein
MSSVQSVNHLHKSKSILILSKALGEAHCHHHVANAINAITIVKEYASQTSNENPAIHLLIHVEISFEDTLLEGIRLSWLGSDRCGNGNGNGSGRSRHLTDALSSLMHRNLSSLGNGRGGREGRTLALRDGALGAGSKLLRPVEASTFTWTSGNGKVRCSSGL